MYAIRRARNVHRWSLVAVVLAMLAMVAPARATTVEGTILAPGVAPMADSLVFQANGCHETSTGVWVSSAIFNVEIYRGHTATVQVYRSSERWYILVSFSRCDDPNPQWVIVGILEAGHSYSFLITSGMYLMSLVPGRAAPGRPAYFQVRFS